MTAEQSQKPDRDNLSAITLGTTMVAGVSFFTYLGYLLDKKFGSDRVWTLVGIFLGLFYCGYEVWRLIRKKNNE